MMNNLKRTWLALLVALAVLITIAGCSKKETTNETQGSSAAETKAASAPIDKSTVGSISGTVKFDGAKPKATKIDMSQDPVCAKKGENVAETVAGDEGDLANVFVYVKNGLADRTYETPSSPVTLDQQGCRYHPHVLGLTAGQTVK